jgi:hypothetical protein
MLTTAELHAPKVQRLEAHNRRVVPRQCWNDGMTGEWRAGTGSNYQPREQHCSCQLSPGHLMIMLVDSCTNQTLIRSMAKVNGPAVTPLRAGGIALAWLGALVCLAGAAQAAKHDDSFGIPREQILASVKTIGVMPLEVTEAVPNAAAAIPRYEAAVVSRLEAAGFAVVKPAVMLQIQDGLLKASGGLYNPLDGRPIEAKVKHYTEESRHLYMEAHPVDAVLYMRIAVRGAETDYDRARWDGVSEGTTGKSGLAAFLTGGSLSGTTPALSFIATLQDRGDRVLYRKAGGLQLLRYAYVGFFGATQRDVDHRYILTDPQRDERAIAIALDSLVGTVSPIASAHVERAPAAQSEELHALGSRAALVARYPRLLLVPLQMADLPQRAAVQARVAQTLKAKLTALGFSVVEAPQYDALWKAEREHVGGFYDPLTGKLDRSKAVASRKAVFASAAGGQEVQAILYPAVVLSVAAFSQGTAQWDGVKERAFVAKSALGKLFNPAKTLVGQIDALSLKLRLADPDEATLLEDSGGLQLIERVANGARTPVPKEELFAEPAREVAAIDLALQSLADAPKLEPGH